MTKHIPNYHEYSQVSDLRVIVLACAECGTPVIPELRDEHTLWHQRIDELGA